MAKVAVYKVMWRNKKTKAESTSYVVAPFRWVDPKTTDHKWLAANPDFIPATQQHDGGELLAILAKSMGLVYGDVEFVSRDVVVAEAVDGQPEPTSSTKPLAPPTTAVTAGPVSKPPAGGMFSHPTTETKKP